MIRVGFGYDAHRLGEGTPLVLGGVALPFPKGLVGHSDGDVLLHAIIDALFGAACLGDIGTHFPDTDPAYAGCSSLNLLAEARGRIAEAGYEVGNVDCTVVAQQPRLQPHIPEMRRVISGVLGVSARQVSLKATTTEHMGFTGREEGMACYAVAALTQVTKEGEHG